MARQLGAFFIYLGLIPLLIFILSTQGDRLAFEFCLAGIALLGIGIFLLRRTRADSQPSSRFRLLHKRQGLPTEREKFSGSKSEKVEFYGQEK